MVSWKKHIEGVVWFAASVLTPFVSANIVLCEENLPHAFVLGKYGPGQQWGVHMY